MLKFGVFWKIQDICYQMSTEIFKIEEEMTEKMKPKVANPPSKNRQNSLLTLCTPLMILCIFMTCNKVKLVPHIGRRKSKGSFVSLA